MHIAEMRERVKKTISKVSGVKLETITDEHTFEALELDSLSRIEILVELEREFELVVPEDQDDEDLINEIQTVEDAVRLVEKNLASAAA